MELTAVSARLGHSSPYVTATIYAHVISGRDDEAAKVWEQFQKRPDKKAPQKAGVMLCDAVICKSMRNW